MKINNFKKKKLKLLTKEHQESYGNAKTCYTWNNKMKINTWNIKNSKS